MPPAERRSRKQHLFLLLLFCSSTAAALLVCELVLALAIPRGGYYVWPPGLEKTVRPQPDIMPGISGESLFAINSLGIRGDELTPAHRHRILAIGGSTTECFYLDQSETWPYALQELMNHDSPDRNVWVGNIGMSGKTTRHHLAAMRFLPLGEMRIDVAIFLVGINDYSLALSRHDQGDPPFLADSSSVKELVTETFVGGDHVNPDDPFFKRTAIWLLAGKVTTMIFEARAQDSAGSLYVTWREHRSQASEIRDALPDLAPALAEYARNINKLIDMAREKSIRPIFMTQPTMWRPDLPPEMEALLWFGGVGDFQTVSPSPYYSATALERGMKAYNDVLLHVCGERRAECLDLASALEKDTTVFYDDVHFNEAGARKVAEFLAKYMRRRAPLRTLGGVQ